VELDRLKTNDQKKETGTMKHGTFQKMGKREECKKEPQSK